MSNILSKLMGSMALVAMLVILLWIKGLSQQISALDRAIRGLPANVEKKVVEKVAEALPKPKSDEETYPVDPDVAQIWGTWYDEFTTGYQRAAMVISPSGMIQFGKAQQDKWYRGTLERTGDKEWSVDLMYFLTGEENEEINQKALADHHMRLQMKDNNTLTIKWDCVFGLKDHFANHGQKFVRWTNAKEKFRFKEEQNASESTSAKSAEATR